MRAAALAAALLAAAGCSRRESANYQHCLRLNVGMTKTELFKIMGDPDRTIPYVEGASLPHLKGRTAYEWSNPPAMPGPDHVSVDDATGKVESILCSSVEITAPVFVEPPVKSTATARRE